MSRLISLDIKNFKGIESLSLDVGKRSSSPVITLIGLNESGKTTILEAISHFITEDSTVSPLFAGVHSKSQVSDLIPVHRKANFTDNIMIGARFEGEADDKEFILSLAKKEGIEVSIERLGEGFYVERIYRFKDSIADTPENLWAINLWVKNIPKRKSRKIEEFKEYIRPSDSAGDFWLKIVRHLQSKMIKFVCFPTFLVDLPSRIYLAPHKNETATNRYYRAVLQDVLTSVGADLNIERHVVKRISDYKASDGSSAWVAFFFGNPTKSYVDSVFQKLANAITKEVIGSWSKVFQRPSGAKSVIVDWNIDTQKEDIPYASFYVSDGESRYAVSERSLGFRWFFSFLLFTAFKKASPNATLFLFDEPAANLHAKAQGELLKNFARIAASENRVIYSTHSHHMIDPRWLSAAYIVENKSIDYDAEENFEINSAPTNIIATNYRNFVSNYSHRTSYFQPVIEKLEYVTPNLIGSSPFVLFEGITDYYAFKYLMLKNADKYKEISLIPGTGAGASGPLISYLLGRGEKFCIVLDDDEAGRRAARQYREGWYLQGDIVATLAELDPKFKGKKLENLISDATKQKISAALGKVSNPNKKEIGYLLAEICAKTEISFDFDEHTAANLSRVLTLAKSRIVS